MLHEKLECYKRSLRLAEEISKDVARWPRGYNYLSDQIKRAIVSVVLNLSEGNARRSNTERKRFFEISRASLAEVASCIDLARVFRITSEEKAVSLKSEATEISKMIWGLIK